MKHYDRGGAQWQDLTIGDLKEQGSTKLTQHFGGLSSPMRSCNGRAANPSRRSRKVISMAQKSRIIHGTHGEQ